MEKASIPLRPLSSSADTLAAPSASEIDVLAERGQSLEQRVASLNDNYETLKKREVELTEWRWVLREAGGFFDRVRSSPAILKFSWLTYVYRLMVAPTKYDNRLTMMKLRSSKTLSSTQPGSMTRRESDPFQL
jgi:hypothetical protein